MNHFAIQQKLKQLRNSTVLKKKPETQIADLSNLNWFITESSEERFLELHEQDAVDLAQNAELANVSQVEQL